MDKELRILLVEDVPADAELEMRELKRAGLRVAHRLVETEEAFRSALKEFRPEIIISDFTMPHFDGMFALALSHELAPDVPFIFVSGTIGEEYAIRALKNGATDYVLKNNLVRLPAAVERALQDSTERAARRRVEEAFRESQEKYRLLWETTSDAAILMDGESRIQYANPAVRKVFGYAPEEVAGRHIAMLQPERLREAHRRGVKRYLETGVKTLNWGATELVALHRDGHEFPVEIAFSHMDIGGKTLFAGFMRDITERKSHELKIARLSRIHAVLSGINSAIVRIRDRQELFNEACRIAVESGRFRMAWIGVAVTGAVKVTPVTWHGHEDGYLAEVGLAMHDIAKDAGTAGQAVRAKRPVVANDIEHDAHVVYKQQALARGYRSLVALPLLVEDQVVGLMMLYSEERGFFDHEEMKLLVELAGDISFTLEHIGKEEKLNYLAYYDALTGLPNRQLFVDRLSQQMLARSGESRMVALILLDIERLRNINETLGRHGGDELLRLVAHRLEHAFHGTDYIARIGAGGFGVVIRGVRDAVEIAHAVESQVLACFRDPFVVNDKELRVAARTGIAMYPTDGDDPDTVFKNAEAALRKAKESGERFLFYTAEMNAQAAQSLSLETRLRKAVEAQQFVLHYQPRIDLSNDAICGLEALIRWQDPETGLVPPGSFIPLLEETGLILEVGKWALTQALLQHREWTARGCVVPRIAVNVSAIQLQQKDFADMVINVLQQGGKIPEALELEITESLLMKDVEASIRKLSILRGLGIHIAMDDFGTGYSSLSYVARLPITSVKIDRSFISGMAGGPQDMAIVTTIIALTHSLNLRAVAEGVETSDQSKLLKLLRCDEAQGFLFSKPLPAAEIEPLLRTLPPDTVDR